MLKPAANPTHSTVDEERRKGVWSGEIPNPIDYEHAPMTKPDHVPWVPGPTTHLYHDNEKYMLGVEKPIISSAAIPRAKQPFNGKVGANWTFLEEDTPLYGGVAWKIGADTSCLELPALLHESESYWIAISMHIYNSSKYWMQVKAQHLSYLETVLSDPSHPRFQYYTQLNSIFRRMPQEYVDILTPPAYLRARHEKRREMALANLYQTLRIPRQFVPHHMLQITADLYSFYIVLFLHTDIDEDYDGFVPDFAARGNWEDRHVAMRLNCNLVYEPLLPIVGDGRAWKLPKVTWKENKVPEGRKGRGEREHPFLCDVEKQEAPAGIVEGALKGLPSDEELEKVLWCKVEKVQ